MTSTRCMTPRRIPQDLDQQFVDDLTLDQMIIVQHQNQTLPTGEQGVVTQAFELIDHQAGQNWRRRQLSGLKNSERFFEVHQE